MAFSHHFTGCRRIVITVHMYKRRHTSDVCYGRFGWCEKGGAVIQLHTRPQANGMFSVLWI